MWYNAKTFLKEGEDGQTRSYLEIPLHFLEEVSIQNGSLVRVMIDQGTNSIIINNPERRNNE
jgi:hypothetical protein